ncbi:hypothetical protein DL96DRAFT_1595319 [Flagelloscypha sp. PMI_526]|nr:hypothetical protein DL96DRAFT_1595319 [Flagelloscypha sp. PMI_526]
MHNALEIVEIRERILGFVGPSALLPLALTCKLFTEFALQGLYEKTPIGADRLNDLLATTLPRDAESRILPAVECEPFLRVARHTRELYYESPEAGFTNLPRIITRDSPFIFPNLQSLFLDLQIEAPWYPAIQAYLPPTLQCLGIRIVPGEGNASDAQIASSSQQQRDFLKSLAQRPETEIFSLSALYFERFDSTLEKETSSHLASFIRTQHKLETLQLDHIPLDLWPHLVGLCHLKIHGYCLPFSLSVMLSLGKVSSLEVRLGEAWQNPRGPVPGVTFPNVQNLYISGPLKYLTSIAKAVQGSGLRTVWIQIRDSWDLSLVNDLLCNLRSEASINSLRYLGWKMPLSGMDPLPFEAFHSVLLFTHMVGLTLDPLCGVDLEDRDLALITQSLPDLQEISVRPPRRRPILTVGGLGHFTKCSQMRSIKLGFLPILPSGTQIPSTTSSKVETIFDLGSNKLLEDALLEDELVVDDLVAFLKAVFPNLKTLKFL